MEGNSCGLSLTVLDHKYIMQQFLSAGTRVKHFPSINNYPHVPVGLFEVCPGIFLIVTAHCYCTLLLHIVTARCYCILLLHIITAHCYCTLSLHIVTAHFFPAIRQPVCRTVPLIAT